MMRWISLAMIFLLPAMGEARTLKVRTLDESGAPFSNVLIIIRSLDKYHEEGRYLTDAKGETTELQVDSGLSQVGEKKGQEPFFGRGGTGTGTSVPDSSSVARGTTVLAGPSLL